MTAIRPDAELMGIGRTLQRDADGRLTAESAERIANSVGKNLDVYEAAALRELRIESRHIPLDARRGNILRLAQQMLDTPAGTTYTQRYAAHMGNAPKRMADAGWFGMVTFGGYAALTASPTGPGALAAGAGGAIIGGLFGLGTGLVGTGIEAHYVASED